MKEESEVKRKGRKGGGRRWGWDGVVILTPDWSPRKSSGPALWAVKQSRLATRWFQRAPPLPQCRIWSLGSFQFTCWHRQLDRALPYWMRTWLLKSLCPSCSGPYKASRERNQAVRKAEGLGFLLAITWPWENDLIFSSLVSSSMNLFVCKKNLHARIFLKSASVQSTGHRFRGDCRGDDTKIRPRKEKKHKKQAIFKDPVH